MTRECQVRICERLGVRLPGPTRHRLSSTVAAFMRQAVEDALTAHPGVTMELGRTLGPRDGIPGPVEAAVFLPSVWAKWADAVSGLVSAVQDEPLAKLASLADQAGQVWDEPGGRHENME